MSSYIPRSLLDQYHAETAHPTYRASMLPFGTYPNADGSGEHLGLAMPGMVSEPVNALMQLIGTPSHPGTMWEGPDYGIASDNPNHSYLPNKDAAATLGETFFGGNALDGIAAGATRGLESSLPSLLESRATDYANMWRNADEKPLLHPGMSHGIDKMMGNYQYDVSPEVRVRAHDLAKEAAGYESQIVNGASPDLYHPLIFDAARAIERYTGSPDTAAQILRSNGVSDSTIANALGGNATRGMGAVERGAVEAAVPLEARAPVSGSVSYPGAISERGYHGAPFANGIDELIGSDNTMWGSSDPDVANLFTQSASDTASPNIHPAQFNFQNPMMVNFDQPAHWGDFNAGGRNYVTPELAQHALSQGHDGLILRNIDEGTGTGSTSYAALKRGTVTSPLTGETLFSDQLPSLPGAVVAGAERQPTLMDHLQAVYRTARYPFERSAVDPRMGPIDYQDANGQSLLGYADGHFPIPESGSSGVRRAEGRLSLDTANQDVDAMMSGEPTPEYYNALLRKRKIEEGSLFSDSLPSLLSSSLQGQQQYPNSLFAQNEPSAGDYLKDHSWQPAPGEDYQTTITPDMQKQLDAAARPHVNFLIDQLTKAYPDAPPKYLSSEAWRMFKAHPSDDYSDLEKKLLRPRPY